MPFCPEPSLLRSALRDSSADETSRGCGVCVGGELLGRKNEVLTEIVP